MKHFDESLHSEMTHQSFVAQSHKTLLAQRHGNSRFGVVRSRRRCSDFATWSCSGRTHFRLSRLPATPWKIRAQENTSIVACRVESRYHVQVLDILKLIGAHVSKRTILHYTYNVNWRNIAIVKLASYCNDLYNIMLVTSMYTQLNRAPVLNSV